MMDGVPLVLTGIIIAISLVTLGFKVDAASWRIVGAIQECRP